MMHVTLQRSNLSYTPAKYADEYVSKYWWPELRLDLSLEGVAADFYLFYAVRDGSEYLRARFEEYAQVVAKQVAIYLDASVGGELRHKGFAGLKKGVGNSRSIARRDWRLKRLVQGHFLLEGGRDCFYNQYWKGGYGGPRWGNITDVLLDHLRGTTDATLFVDLALALQHNGGCVFNKLQGYWVQKNIMKVLDANLNEDWETLLEYASPWAKEMFLNWLTEEDEVVVEGVDWSAPRQVKQGSTGTGARVRISEKARSVAWRGKLGWVVGTRDVADSKGNPLLDYAVKLDGGSEVKWMRAKSIILVESTDEEVVGIEYITEA